MAKSLAAQDEELATVFRGAHRRADSELSGFRKAFKIRDRLFGNRETTTGVYKAKMASVYQTTKIAGVYRAKKKAKKR